jgi:pimeloyl-ACP methyl ester carboxylesterase
MSVFGLVHGGCHGAWCWERLVPYLESAGHRAVTVELPIEDPEAGAEEYARTITEALPDTDDTVLVGHSLAGLSVPVAAAVRPVRLMVFLCAVLPDPGRSLMDQLAERPGAFEQAGVELDEAARIVFPPDIARDRLYHDCSMEVTSWALARLRPQAVTAMVEMTPLTAWPDVATAYICCTEDRLVDPAWGAELAESRLGRSPIDMAGSHSPFLSRPAELAERLLALAERD